MAQLSQHYQRVRSRLHTLRHWWLRPHAPFRAVFILATQRSGSNLVRDYVKRLPGVASHGEVLCTEFPYGPSRKLPTAAALRHLRYALQTLDAPLRACKLMLDHLCDHQLTVDDLRAAFSDSRFIVLYRRWLAEQ